MGYNFKYTKETVKVFVKPILIEILDVTNWHETCLRVKTQTNLTIMNNLFTEYQNAKLRSKEFMKNGQLHRYFETLIEMNNYKKLMVKVIAN